MTVAQEPETARYDSMPRSAVATGLIDYVLPVEQIPARLLAYRHFVDGTIDANAEIPPPEALHWLHEVCTILHQRCGHDFSRYKHNTLIRRVQRRVHLTGSETVAGYLELLRSHPREPEELFKDLLVGVTQFFRDPDSFLVLEREVIPKLFEGRKPDDTVRVWVAGCSTGEEVYSIAILLREHALTLGPSAPRIQLFATDLDVHALELARIGRYRDEIADQVTPERLERFFTKTDELYQVVQEIRELCIFSAHNLIKDPPFSRLSLVSCRNVMIYLGAEVQTKLLGVLHYALAPGGYLFLGPAEGITGQIELYRPVDRQHRLFQRRDNVVLTPLRLVMPEPSQRRSLQSETSRPGGRLESAGRTMERFLLDSFAPAAVMVNERGDIGFYSGLTAKYLEQPAGAPTVNLFSLARQALRLDLRAVVQQAVATRQMAVQEGSSVEIGGKVQRLRLVARPMAELGDESGLYLVLFEEVGHTMSPEQAEAAGASPRAESAVVDQLENELRMAKQSLHTTVEELETSNEELFAMNEELQSSNEELQTSKEELQSINEELETVNVELRKKVDELNGAHGVLQNLFQSTQVASIFLDRDLKIYRFTPASVEVFRLIESDIGRPLADIVPRFAGVDLAADVREVLQTSIPREQQVHLEDRDVWFILRIFPYRRMDNRIDGVVLTFVDVTELRRAQAELEAASRNKDEFMAMLAHELRNPLAPIRNCLHLMRLPGAGEHTEQALRTMERQVVHLSRLIDDLLDVSRIARGKILLRKEPLDLVEVVRITTEDNRGVLEAAGLELELEVCEGPLHVVGDRTRLVQALGNLLRNAGKFTDSGGKVQVKVRHEGSNVVVSVCDTGIGIEPALLERIFEPFSQADHSLARSRGGLGLGLTLVRGLIELHGGSVEARSDGPACGTELLLQLPLETTLRPAVLLESQGAQASDRRRVLIVEDSADAAESMALLLELKGHRVMTAKDGVMGVAAARQFQPEVIVCDIGLPGELDGYGLARELRSDTSFDDVPMIALTGYGHADDQRRAREAGFDEHVTKPADPRVLEKLLRDVQRR